MIIDLTPNVRKAVEILNNAKGLNIVLDTQERLVDITPPVGISQADHLEDIKNSPYIFCFSCDVCYFGVDFSFDLLSTTDADKAYVDNMKLIMKKIYDAYILNKDTGVYQGPAPTTNTLNGQTITGTKTFGGNTIMSNLAPANIGSSSNPFSNVYADDFLLDNGNTSLKGELDKAKRVEAELRLEIENLKIALDKRGLLD